MTGLPTSGTRRSETLDVSWLTDRGRERANNEDACLALPDQGIILVSDGMGGEAAGEVASRHVVEWLPPLLTERLVPVDNADAHAVERAVAQAVQALSQRILAESSGLDYGAKMGATLTMILWVPPRMYVAHVGDSRAYLLRSGRLTRLTHDHSVVGTLVERGIITPDQAVGHPMRGQLTRYVGMSGSLRPDVSRMRPETGDMVLLCTDGLSDQVPDERICELVLRADGLSAACHALIEEANDAGGRDNITAMLATLGA